MNTDSILQSMRKFLTGNVEDDYYDPDLIMYINSVLVILDQLGDSMPNTIFVTGINETWTDLIPDRRPAIWLSLMSPLKSVNSLTRLQIVAQLMPSIRQSLNSNGASMLSPINSIKRRSHSGCYVHNKYAL